MNISEANAVNIVLNHALGLTSATGEVPPTELARKQAAWLADRANATLKAGLTGVQVHNAWPEEDAEVEP